MNIMKKIIITLFVMLGLFATSCDINPLKDAVDDFNLVIELEPINTSGAVMLYDAATGQVIRDEVTVTFEPLSNDVRVIDFYSDPYETATIKNGVAIFGIGNEYEPNPDQPARVRVRYSAPGYKDFTQTLNLNTPGANNFTARMINTSNPPEGVTLANVAAGSVGEDGASSEPVTVSVGGSSMLGLMNDQDSDLEIYFPAGTRFFDEEGNPLTGNLTASVDIYNTNFPGAVNGLPADLKEYAEDNNAIVYDAFQYGFSDEHGQQLKYVVYPDDNTLLGVVGDSGLERKKHKMTHRRLSSSYTIDQFLRMELKISASTASFEDLIDWGVLEIYVQGSTEILEIFGFKAEDCPPDMPQEIRSYFCSINNNSDIIPGVHISIPPLSPTIVEEPAQTCNGTITLNRNGVEGALDLKVNRTGVERERTITSSMNSITINDLPAGAFNVKVSNAVSSSEEITHDFCANPNLDITMPEPPPNLITAEVNVTLQCPNAEEKVRTTGIPATYIYYRKLGSDGDYQTVREEIDWNYNSSTKALEGGTFVMTSVEQGETYEVKINYDDNEEVGEVDITGTNITYIENISDGGVCN